MFKIKASYVFNSIAIGLMLISILLYLNFENTKNKIFSIGGKANLEYVKSLADNLSNDILRVTQVDLADSIRDDELLKEYIKSDLKLFVTTKYKYIYLVAKDKNSNFSIIVNSSKDFNEQKKLLNIYSELDSQKFSTIYKTQKYLYLKHENREHRGASYLKPIIQNNKVEAVIVVEFSLAEQNTIASELHAIEDMFETAIVFFILIFIFILWFSYMDSKREKEKHIAFSKLEESNSKLAEETAKVHSLNNSLEDRVKIEVDKNRAKEAQMIHQARLAQMGEMISMIAHQWRQPLTAISATSTDISIKAQLNKLQPTIAIELAGKISKYSQHLSSTIDDFRDFFKPNKEKKKTSYNELIQSVLSIIEVSIKNKNIEIVTELRSDDTLYTYPNELKQVILNLIKNAEDILLENSTPNPCIEILTYKTETHYILEVKDNAGGVPQQIIDDIFNPYFSTKTKKDGTGLGLYMSKTIIEEHCHGELSVYNDAKGAVFGIKLTI